MSRRRPSQQVISAGTSLVLPQRVLGPAVLREMFREPRVTVCPTCPGPQMPCGDRCGLAIASTAARIRRYPRRLVGPENPIAGRYAEEQDWLDEVANVWPWSAGWLRDATNAWMRAEAKAGRRPGGRFYRNAYDWLHAEAGTPTLLAALRPLGRYSGRSSSAPSRSGS